MDGVTATLARFLVNSQPGEVPDAVVHEAKRALLHWIGCSVGGSQQESVRCALATVDEFSGPRQASVLGRRERLDIMLAALVNGISSDVLSFTDTHAITLIHPGAVIGAPLLALAERKKITGRDFVHAFILGFEVSSRVSLAVFPWHYLRGWHITGTAGIFGATAAAGKILGLDEQHMVWALGIAATQSAGLRGSFGSMSKNLHIGRAAQNGLFSALLASNGYTGSNQGIEAKRGFANVFGEAPNLAAITTKLGESWELPQNTYKAFPCGSVIHPVIEGCLKLKSSNQIAAKDIQRIALRVHPLVIELTGRESPTNTLEAKLSVYHSAAAALIAGKMTLEEYSARSVSNPDVIALRKKVTATADAAIRDDEAYVSIELVDGKHFHHHVDHVIGSSGCPLTDNDIETKFRGLTEPLLPKASVERLIDKCWSLTQINDSAVLARLASLE